jgi:hypothetical protein
MQTGSIAAPEQQNKIKNQNQKFTLPGALAQGQGGHCTPKALAIAANQKESDRDANKDKRHKHQRAADAAIDGAFLRFGLQPCLDGLLDQGFGRLPHSDLKTCSGKKKIELAFAFLGLTSVTALSTRMRRHACQAP